MPSTNINRNNNPDWYIKKHLPLSPLFFYSPHARLQINITIMATVLSPWPLINIDCSLSAPVMNFPRGTWQTRLKPWFKHIWFIIRIGWWEKILQCGSVPCSGSTEKIHTVGQLKKFTRDRLYHLNMERYSRELNKGNNSKFR